MFSSVLDRPTLILNRSWQAVAVSTAARSLVKVYRGAAHVVDPNDYQLYDWNDWAALPAAAEEVMITTPYFQLRAPEVVVLSHYDCAPDATVSFSRRNLFRRDQFTCQYCGKRPGSDDLTVDHVVPRSRGGASCWENCVLACVKCNRRKADKSPAQARMPLLRQPKKPRWKPIYAAHGVRLGSWAKFVSDVYWNIELES